MDPRELTEGINPKDLIGVTKPDYSCLPLTALYEVGKAAKNGSDKYGSFNWRDIPVQAKVYIDAARRHIDLWSTGEEDADDSKVHHLAHAVSGLLILMDAQRQGMLKDDRHFDPTLAAYIKAHTKT